MKLNNFRPYLYQSCLLLTLFLTSLLITLPSRAQSNSDSTFQPSSVLDSPKRSGGDIMDTLGRESEFQTLFSVLNQTEIAPLLKQEGKQFTLLAPSNLAFRQNGPFYAQLLQPQNRPQLIKFLQAHIIPKLVTREDVEQGTITTLGGQSLKITNTNQGIIFNDQVKAVLPSIETKNGVIVRLDNLLTPTP